MKHIIVGIDGRERSYHALAFAAGLAQRESAALSVCYVFCPHVQWPPLTFESLFTSLALPAPMSDDAVGTAIEQEVADKATEIFDRAHIHGQIVVRTGRVVDELVKLADEQHADLIVIGKPHRLGSRLAIARHLAHRSPHGLFIVP